VFEEAVEGAGVPRLEKPGAHQARTTRQRVSPALMTKATAEPAAPGSERRFVPTRCRASARRSFWQSCAGRLSLGTSVGGTVTAAGSPERNDARITLSQTA